MFREPRSTATLLRRAIKQAASQTSWSEPVIVARNGLDYEYRLPEKWKQPANEEALGALRVVAAELRVLFVADRTGCGQTARASGSLAQAGDRLQRGA